MIDNNYVEEIEDIGGTSRIISPHASNVRCNKTITKPNGTSEPIDNVDNVLDVLLAETSNNSKDVNIAVQTVPLGDFTKITSGTYSGYIQQKDIICPSSHGATYYFKLPENFVAIVGHSTDAPSALTYSEAITNGGSFTFPNANNVQRLLFCRKINGNVDATLGVDDVKALIASEDIKVTYNDYDVNVLNIPKDALITWSKSSNGNNRSFPLPYYRRIMLCHLSDSHGDIVRVNNVLKFAKVHDCDEVIHTGDATMYSTQGISHVFENAKQIGKHISFCLGNHESYSYSNQPNHISDMENYGDVNNYQMPDIFKGYYYYDIPNKNVRIIALNLYEDGSYSGASACKVTQTQLEWFVATLKSTPNDYGVIVIMHQCDGPVQDFPDTTEAETIAKFQDTSYTDWSYGILDSLKLEHPINKIIDAFTRRTTYTLNYTGKNSSGNINFTADFTDYSNTAHFVCYLVGHSHGDGIALSNVNTSRQVVFRVTSANSLQTSGGGDLAFAGGDMFRYAKGVTQDAFNLLGIDLTYRTIRVVRIGSDLNYNLIKRDYVEIKYSDRVTVTRTSSDYINISQYSGQNGVWSYAHKYTKFSWKLSKFANSSSYNYTWSVAPTATMVNGSSIVQLQVTTDTDGNYIITTDWVTGDITINCGTVTKSSV